MRCQTRCVLVAWDWRNNTLSQRWTFDSNTSGNAAYAASKGGVISFTKSVAKEYAGRGIRSNAICPGFIRSAMTDKLSPEVQQKMMDVIPLKQFGTPEDIGNVVLFLASDLSGYVTGQALSVCGGMVTH